MDIILLYGVIPVLTVAILFFAKRKLLWIAPFLSSAAYFILYMASLRFSGMESPISKIFGYSEWRAFFLLGVLFQFVIAVILTLAAYLIFYIQKQKRR